MATLSRCDLRPAAACAVVLILLLRLMSEADAQTGNIASVSNAQCNDMRTHNVMRADAPVDCDRLRLITFPYVGFDNRVHGGGQIVVMDAAAESVLRIFTTLHDMRFPIAKARLMNHYEGNDSASTADNNTSSFNARRAVGSSHFSTHAYGLAIDLNPVQNPFATRSGNTLRFMPPAGIEYSNRWNDRAGKNFRGGMAESVIDVFAEHGFLIWGGYWDNPIDYQHFEVTRTMVERLATMPAAQAQAAFRQYVERYRACRKAAPPDSPRSKCITER